MARTLRKNLEGGDLRSLGDSAKAVKSVASNPRRFDELFGNLFDSDRLVRMRAADAIEKITRARPELLHPWKHALLEQISAFEEKEVRWHVAQLLPRLKLTSREKEIAMRILLGYLADHSSIVKTLSMQGLVDLARGDQRLTQQISPVIERLTEVGTPAMRARGRMLMKQLRHPRDVEESISQRRFPRAARRAAALVKTPPQ